MIRALTAPRCRQLVEFGRSVGASRSRLSDPSAQKGRPYATRSNFLGHPISVGPGDSECQETPSVLDAQVPEPRLSLRNGSHCVAQVPELHNRSGRTKWRRWDSNPRPPACKAVRPRIWVDGGDTCGHIIPCQTVILDSAGVTGVRGCHGSHAIMTR